MNIGIIGCGGIGQLRAEALRQVPEFKLLQAYDLDRQRLDAFSHQYGCSAARAWQDLINEPGIGAVIVSTPPSLHHEMCVAALAAGKNVLCEKPLARTPKECQEIVNAGSTAQKFVATGFNYRFFPSMLKSKELLDSGLIGDLEYIRSYAGYSAADHSQAWHHDAEVIGGGALWDNGIHLIDLTRWFLGEEVNDIKGFTTDRIWRFPGSEDNGFGLLRTSSGKTAALHASWTEWAGYQFKIELYGSQGCIQTTIFPMSTSVTWFNNRGEKPNQKTFRFPKVFLMEHLRSYRWVSIQSFILEFQAFRKSLQGEKSSIATGLDGMRAIEIATAINNN